MTTIFAVLFLLLDGGRAMLRIKAHNASRLDISVVHEKITAQAELHSLSGDGELTIAVNDNEAIVLLVRTEGQITASAVFSVDTALAETHGAILVPQSITGVIVDQCEFGEVQCAFDKSIVGSRLNEEVQVL